MEKTDLDTTNAEFNKSTQHLSTRYLIGGPADADLDQKTVVVRRDLSARKTGTGVESDTITAGAAIHFDLSCVWLEVCPRVFSSNTTLNCVAALGDRVLRQTELRKTRASCDLDLGGDDVQSGDFLCRRVDKWTRSGYRKLACDRMLDLDTGINLDEVVSSLLVN